MFSYLRGLSYTNINKLHSGLYKVQIINGDVKHKSFSVAVYGLLTVPVISDSPRNLSISERSSQQNCSLVCSAVNVGHVTLSWYRGHSLLSSISVSDLSSSLSLPLEIECLDDSYSCAVSYSFTNQTKHLNITDLCQTCSDGQPVSVKPLILATLILLLLLVVSVLAMKMFCHSRSYKEAAQESNSDFCGRSRLY
uniref:Ig-like domain-containing protein n=1 Tax=Cyprinus carpio carpio TaxID=630221 RepID=A0A9J7ZNB5_CYPCA